MIQIRIQQSESVLDEWLALNGCTTWAFITAWNPIDVEPHNLHKNKSRSADLLTALHHSNCIVLPGWGVPDDSLGDFHFSYFSI